MVHLIMVTPGQFDDAEGEEVALAEKEEPSHLEISREQCWEEGDEELYGDEDSDGEDFIDEYVEAGKGALHASNHPNQQVRLTVNTMVSNDWVSQVFPTGGEHKIESLPAS